MHNLSITDAQDIDPSELAALRVEAMRPSLEAVGRFDPVRARNRFLEGFNPEDTRLVWSGEQLAGFFVVQKHADHLYLDHIYIEPRQQGGGIGRGILSHIQDRARREGLPIRLIALKDSPANAFYLSCGFEHCGTDEFDNRYVWHPQGNIEEKRK